MPSTTIDRLIINSPYEEPSQHWRYERETRTFDLAEGRRPAGRQAVESFYPVAKPARGGSYTDPHKTPE